MQPSKRDHASLTARLCSAELSGAPVVAKRETNQSHQGLPGLFLSHETLGLVATLGFGR